MMTSTNPIDIQYKALSTKTSTHLDLATQTRITASSDMSLLLQSQFMLVDSYFENRDGLILLIGPDR